ncbi:TonB-dependent receptor [Methylogaea oryzae]|uniref:TonB-dependent receptor n=1 Tax=Methylogaea oryzae TaxID=1295382 RepID=UPI0030DA69A9
MEPSLAGLAAGQRHGIHHRQQRPAAADQRQQLRLHQPHQQTRHRGRRARQRPVVRRLLRHPHRASGRGRQAGRRGLHAGARLCQIGRPPRQCRRRAEERHGPVGLQINQHWATSVNFLYTSNTASDPGDSRLPKPSVAPQYTTEAGMVSAALSHEHGSWLGEFRVYHNAGDGNWLNQSGTAGDTLSSFNMDGLRWKEQFSLWEGGTVKAGIDNDWISGQVRFKPLAPEPKNTVGAPTFRVTSPYVGLSQDIALGSDWTLTPSAGVRFYDHNQFESNTAPHFGLSLASERLTVFGNLSRGVNFAGLETAVLSSIMPLGSSWKQLTAEEMDHAEVGFKAMPFDSTQVDFSYFVDHVKNRYIFGFPPDVPPPPQFINLGAYRMKGMELAIRQDIGRDWSVFGGLTLLDPSIGHLPYTPRSAVTAGVNGKVGPVKLALDMQYQGDVWALNRSRFGGASNTEKVESFTVVNARVSYPLPVLGKKVRYSSPPKTCWTASIPTAPVIPCRVSGARWALPPAFEG